MDEDSDNECPICFNDIKPENKVKLKCGHCFNYDCILLTYQNEIRKASRYYKGKKRICPYCRGDGGYLPLKPGMLPIQYIHKEYTEFAKTENVSQFLIPNKCQAILKTGKNKGQQCKCDIEKNGFCKRHQPKVI